MAELPKNCTDCDVALALTARIFKGRCPKCAWGAGNRHGFAKGDNHGNHRGRHAGIIDGLHRYAWWKDGVQYVGTCSMTLEEAIEMVNEEMKQDTPEEPMAEQRTNDDRIDRLERAVRHLAECCNPGGAHPNMLLEVQKMLTPPEEKKPLLKWEAVYNGWFAKSKRHKKGVTLFYLYRVSKDSDGQFSIATSDSELLCDGEWGTFYSEEDAKGCCERLEASSSLPKPPEEKKPPEPSAFQVYWSDTYPSLLRGSQVESMLEGWNAALDKAAEQFKHGGGKQWPSSVVDAILALKEHGNG